MGSSTNNDNVFRILVATDNHLGYKEKDSERENDSFNTFEEILQIALEKNVDFILLGGDLFHENKPTRNTVIKCMELIRKYTFGDKPVEFDFLSDPAVNFPHLKNPSVNYLDPNLNVSIPVFSIHGNHDDPTGQGQYSALDMLASAGLVNYFGRCSDLKQITINPLLLQKGDAKLAIYGLSAIKDERLYRLFNTNMVKMLRPRESLEDWCNLMVVHQNHQEHGPTNYLPESFLDSFLDLVIWGHEHECLLEPTSSKSQDFFVSQPGSSVATSLCKGESVAKFVGLLEITTEKNFRMVPIPLKTVRPLMFEDVCLADHGLEAPAISAKIHPVEEFVSNYIYDMIEKSKEKLTNHPRQPKKPLIRLRVEYNEEWELFNVQRFGHNFNDLVANPSDMILFKKQRQGIKKSQESDIDTDVLDALFEDEDIHQQKVEDLVENYFANLEDESHRLQLLTESGLARSVTNFVDKDDGDAIKLIVTHQIDKMRQHLGALEDLEEDDIKMEILRFKTDRMNRHKAEEDQEVEDKLKNRIISTKGGESDFDMDEDEEQPKRSTSGRGGARGRGRGKVSPVKQPLKLTSDPAPSRGRSKGRGRAANTVKQNSMMESFCKSSSNRSYSSRRGANFDSDSD